MRPSLPNAVKFFPVRDNNPSSTIDESRTTQYGGLGSAMSITGLCCAYTDAVKPRFSCTSREMTANTVATSGLINAVPNLPCTITIRFSDILSFRGVKIMGEEKCKISTDAPIGE